MGIVFVEIGQVTKDELAQNFSAIYKTNWPRQIRKLDDWTFLVKFPPHIHVDQVAGYPLFGLPAKDGVTVNVEVWKGELEHFEDLHNIRVELEGLEPNWAESAILGQFAFAFGTLLDVDRQGNF